MDRFQQRLTHLTIHGAIKAFAAIEAVDSALHRLPLYRWPRAVVLDTILGPAEEAEYVSRTAPATAPPTI